MAARRSDRHCPGTRRRQAPQRRGAARRRRDHGGLRFKIELPNYGVFDEKRVFVPGTLPGPIAFRGVRIGVPICEDIWGRRGRVPAENRAPRSCWCRTARPIVATSRHPAQHRGGPRHRDRAADSLCQRGRRAGRGDLRRRFLRAQRRSHPRRPAAGLPRGGVTTTWRRGAAWLGLRQGPHRGSRGGRRGRLSRPACSACATTSRRTAFPAWCSAFPGGIDSAICAAMAVDALGAERVHCVMLPFRYTSPESLDGRRCLREGARRALRHRADRGRRSRAWRRARAAVHGQPRDITEENMQSRVRGTILMSISNKFGPMVVTTGNKSEMSVGYATLYGDMNGGFNPIKDLYKTEVYRSVGPAQSLEAGRRARARRHRHPGEHPHQGADGRTAREPEGPGFAAALRRARRYPALPRRARDARRRDRRARP